MDTTRCNAEYSLMQLTISAASKFSDARFCRQC